MRQTVQVDVGHRLFDYIDWHTSATAADIYQQPVSDYTSPDQVLGEKALFFRGAPLCMGISSQLPEAGSYMTTDHGGVPILITRDGTHRVQACLNVCRHRGGRWARAYSRGRTRARNGTSPSRATSRR